VIEGYNGYVTDSQNGHVGFLEGSAVFTLDGGGHTGKPGDRAIDLEGVGAGGDIHVGSASFLNKGATNNTLSFSLWMKMHHISTGAALWARSPSSSGGERGFAVAPYSDDNIYFDTAGCCDTTLERLVAPISALPGYVDDSFWTSWHHYAFIYNAGDKQIWIDGVELADGSNTAPLPMDFGDLYFGYDPLGNAYQQTLVDDVAVFATPLSLTNISALAGGASPAALTGETLLAYWDFDTVSPGPPFISLASTPAPGSTNAPPDVEANIVIVNRNTQVQTNTIRVAFDGKDVTGAAAISTNSAGATLTFVSPTVLSALSSNWLTVVFSDNATPPNFVSNTWSFVVGPYGAYCEDAVHSYLGFFLGSTHFTETGGGHTGSAGDRAIDLGTDGVGGAEVTDPRFLGAVNGAARLDTLSVSFWLKQSSIPGSSAFWFCSPSLAASGAPTVGGGGRDFQAHAPWSDDNIYFDTDGCCNAPQRIVANINTFPAWTSDAFWNSWHHFVFLKNGVDKQIYIDGQLFLDGVQNGDTAAPLAADINELLIGNGSGSPYGQLDDFAVFGEALTPAAITALYSGTSPLTLGDPNLLAFWSFDNAGPAFLVSRSPAPNATGVPAFGPAGHLVAVLFDGSTSAVNPAGIRLALNGVDVSSQVVVSHPAPGETTAQYAPSMLASGSTNLVTLVFSDNATPPNVVSNSWSFVAETYTGITKDILHGYLGLLLPSARFTPNGGGHSGLPGDYAIDMATSGGPVHIDDATFLYPAETNNTMTFAFWLKKYDIASSSAFWVNSPSSSGGGRGFQVHLPWSNDNIYFDTSGCCDGSLQRISAPISALPAYVNDGFWTNWHHFVFLYNAGDKQIYIDGQLFLDGSSSSPLALDFTDMFLGRDVADALDMHGVMDDFAAFSTAVSAANIALLYQGTLPTALANESILAYWPFDDAPARPTIGIALVKGKVVITYTGTLQSSATVNGTYSAVTGANSPYTPSGNAPRTFYRAQQ
jgi:hypothetical protein